ncbi:elongation factor G [Streptomyces sp. SCSIO ZS0520]|uniref:elongation factor G n=1 Tax=Streptomyces sp. SCSIO ZS0520 TaxID=2892996 RepID=UPI0021DA99BA|nr:TetM/TetW/TetO/TetS family tetracycline resistance ribosomal protection protein [Streptomyces sp. SCSIO ZS0520]
MHTLNLGILAHVDAGKTSLTERLLHTVGVIDEIGRVDEGSTHTDSLPLERQRGITIKSAVASFTVDGVAVNLIDTPGHPDFIAEVERALRVLDGAVLVVSAVEGVQAQTRILMRTLRRLRVPTLVFVNKVDRAGARYAPLLRALTERLAPTCLALDSVEGIGTRAARSVPLDAGDAAFTERLTELLAERDEALLADWLALPPGEAGLPYPRLLRELAAQSRRGLVHPVLFGSAATGTGVAALVSRLTGLLPTAASESGGPAAGTVFKIEQGPAGDRTAWVRMFSGTVRTRQRLGYGEGREGKVTGIGVFAQGECRPSGTLRAGQIGTLRGLGSVRIGDRVGERGEQAAGEREFAPPSPESAPPSPEFAPPSLETVVVPVAGADRAALHTALLRLAEQDPLIGLRREALSGELAVSLYGEVQKEVLQATLAEEYGVRAEFHESTTLHIERPLATGAAAEFLHAEGNPFLATVGLRLEPAASGSGVVFRLGVELGSMPAAFFKAVEESVHGALEQGLRGWRVTDCAVTLTHCGYAPRQSHAHAVFDKSMSSTAGDFRHLTPLVLMSALEQAGTTVLEPLHRFTLEIPAGALGSVLPVLTRLRAVPRTSVARGEDLVLEGEVPAASVHALELRLPSLTSGEGVLSAVFGHYAPVHGPVPARPRAEPDALRRKDYLLETVRRTTGARDQGQPVRP